MSFSNMVTSSVFARALALLILAFVMLAAIVVGAVELIRGQEVNPIIYTIIGVGIGTAGAIVNINFGVVLQPMKETTPEKAAPAPGGTNGINP